GPAHGRRRECAGEPAGFVGDAGKIIATPHDESGQVGAHAEKLQIPTSNIQRSAKLKTPIRRAHVLFGAWCLKFLWSLDVGAWSFMSASTVRRIRPGRTQQRNMITCPHVSNAKAHRDLVEETGFRQRSPL